MGKRIVLHKSFLCFLNFFRPLSSCISILSISFISQYITLSFFLFGFQTPLSYGQTTKITGRITTQTEPVQYALITFINITDSLQKFSALTDSNGHYELYIITTSVYENKSVIPKNFELAQNYPNPFSTETAIPYKLNNQSNVNVAIYNILGQEIKRLPGGLQSAGVYVISWDGKNDFCEKVASGIYFYRLQAGNEVQVKKLVVKEGSLIGSPSLNNNYHVKDYLNKQTGKQLSAGEFSVQINSTNWTKPKMISTQFSVVVQHDTTLNFEVQLGITAYSMCYQRQDSISFQGTGQNLIWSVYLNNIDGSNKKTIINLPENTEYPSWSPGGKFIAFVHQQSEGERNLYLYNTYNDTLIQLTSSGNVNTYTPFWTSDSKRIIYSRWVAGIGAEAHIIDSDGRNDKKLKFNPSYPDVSFLFNDNFTCLCVKDNKIYKTDIDSSIFEFIIDLRPASDKYFTIRDFNPYTGDLLINTNAIPGSNSAIVEFNVLSKQMKILITADKDFGFAGQRYSQDYSKIVFVETNSRTLEEYLSIFDNGTKNRLIGLIGGMKEWFDYNPMEFSPDGKYVAFSKNVTQEGEWFSWKSYLYAINVETGQTTLIDSGVIPQWNPRKPH